VNKDLEKLKKEIERHKEKNPAYEKILDFYKKVREKQLDVTPALSIAPIEAKDDVRALQAKEGFPLINKEDFTIDIPSSVLLFESLSTIAKDATSTMNEDIQKIEKAVTDNKLHLDELLLKHSDNVYQEEISEELKINKPILQFLIHMSILPSIHANVELLKDHIDLKNWIRGYCPICGSLPNMSELKGEGGKRHFLCSFCGCGFIWPSQRLKCPFCDNQDHKKLHFFYAEGGEALRVDLCEQCKQYIKTVDTRKLAYEPDLDIEDIATIHLDILASEKGFKSPVPSLWGI
jgi:FdhE protein